MAKKYKNNPKNCPEGKYWISPHQRKRKDKDGKTYIEKVKGYCCIYPGPYYKIAEEEKIPYDYLFFVLTLYGESRGENDASKRAIAWIIKNRLLKNGDTSYKKVVLRKNQFSCWRKSDHNYEKMQHPGKDGTSADKNAWSKCKIIAREIQNAPENKNPIPDVYHYFSGKPKLRWQKNYFNLPGVPNFHFVKFK